MRTDQESNLIHSHSHNPGHNKWSEYRWSAHNIQTLPANSPNPDNHSYNMPLRQQNHLLHISCRLSGRQTEHLPALQTLSLHSKPPAETNGGRFSHKSAQQCVLLEHHRHQSEWHLEKPFLLHPCNPFHWKVWNPERLLAYRKKHWLGLKSNSTAHRPPNPFDTGSEFLHMLRFVRHNH